MKTADIAEVWGMLDRDSLRRVVATGPAAVFATISGAHLYGFASRDSDVDLRGAFLLRPEELLGLTPQPETITIVDNTDVELDWVAHDLRKFARLMTNHNGYVLEQLFSPLVVLTSPEHEELLELGRGCVTRPLVRHYLGFARSRLKRLEEPDATVKHLLYAYRVYLSGIHVMSCGEIESNLHALNEKYQLRTVEELIARKREGSEAMRLAEGELEAHRANLAELELELHKSHEASKLPEEPTTVAELDAFVVRARLSPRQA